MNNKQVKSYFIDKKDIQSPITDRLVGAGYRQKSGGYISYARKCGLNNPTQYWHLIYSWCERSKDTALFTRSIQCGELIFWMAEVSGAVDEQTLNNLANLIIDSYL